MIEQEYGAIFNDDRDKEYRKINPHNCYYFDMFILKKVKCPLDITDTEIINGGSPKSWLFTS